MLKTTQSNDVNYVTIAQVRTDLVESLYEIIALKIKRGMIDQEKAAKTMQAFQDVIHKGARTAGHADMISDTVRDNLAAFVAALDTDQDA